MPLQRSEVVTAAMRILDGAGLDALTTRKLASELNVRPGALYWHVSSKQDLLDSLTEKILEEVGTPPLAPRESWEAGVRELVHRLRDTLVARRDTLLSHVTGFVLQEQSEPDHSAPDAADGGPEVLDEKLFPHLAAWAQGWSPDDRGLSFAAGLEVLVGGLDRYLAAQAKSRDRLTFAARTRHHRDEAAVRTLFR